MANPTLLMTDSQGQTATQQIGFIRSDWQVLVSETLDRYGVGRCAIDWSSLPEWRPGCGSLSVYPAHAERLQAQADNSPIRHRAVHFFEPDEIHHVFCRMGGALVLGAAARFTRFQTR